VASGNSQVRPDASISLTDAERLTPQQERDLAIAAEAGDANASRRLVDAFLPSIIGLARRFPSGAGVERQELVQEGVAGLLFAAQRYDPRRDTPFWAYASFWVRKAMQGLVAELTRPVALSDRAVRGLARIKAARQAHLQAYGSEPTNDDLSRASGFTPTQVECLLAVERTPRGMEEPLSPDKGVAATVGDTIVDPAAELAFDRVLDEIEIREARDFANRLDERERAVIQGHYGLDQPAQTLNQIGGALGLTAERARQIELDALDKLRAALVQATPAVGEPA
jgi:RNA polymerase primary sigma factor